MIAWPGQRRCLGHANASPDARQKRGDNSGSGINVTSSLFLTGLAPNLLAVELVNKTSKISLSWTQWFTAFAPIGITLLILVPLLTYWIYPPEVKEGSEVPAWAAGELQTMGDFSGRETTLAILVVIALLLWIFGGDYINPTTAALVVISLMLITNVVTWDDIIKNSAAWNTLAWFATLVALADGLNKVGFVKWFADAVAAHMSGFSPFTAMIVLVLVFYFTHYLFASVTAHVTALLPVMLAVGSTIPGMNMPHFALLLCLTLGIMGVLTRPTQPVRRRSTTVRATYPRPITGDWAGSLA